MLQGVYITLSTEKRIKLSIKSKFKNSSVTHVYISTLLQTKSSIKFKDRVI